MTRSGGQRQVDALRIGAVASLAYVFCDALHELGHLAAAFLPLGVTAVSISTIGLSSIGSSAVVAAAGPAVNLALGASIALALVRKLHPSWRYFFWLFGTVNLFNASAYLLYSSILGSGDWAVVFGSFATSAVWRPVATVCGLAAYAGCIHAAQSALRQLVEAGVVAGADVESYCTISYWVGGSVLTLASVFNPVSWWFVLTSGAATGFGAMVGLLLLPKLIGRSQREMWPATVPVPITMSWVAAGAVAAALFIGVLGPGIRLA